MERAPTWGAREFVVLEEPGQQKNDDDKRDQTATDIHSGLLCVRLLGYNGAGRLGVTEGSLRWRGGAVAEWLGRGLQSLVQRFESARRLQACACAGFQPSSV